MQTIIEVLRIFLNHPDPPFFVKMPWVRNVYLLVKDETTGIIFVLDPFVCGSCSVKEDILCSNQKMKIFYQDKEKMSREELEDYKYQGLVSRALQSIEDKEHLQFPGSSKPDFILFLRFKFGLCEKEAGTVFDRLQADRAVDVNEQHSVLVKEEVVKQLLGTKINNFSVFSSYRKKFEVYYTSSRHTNLK